MPLTLAEKLLSLSAGKEVKAGQTSMCRIDLAMVHEAGAQMLAPLEEMGVKRVWDPGKVIAVIDHWVPASSEKSAGMHQKVRVLVEKYGITCFHDIGNHGICHQLMAEQGLVRPGMLVVGTDSHTTTSGALGAFATGIGPTEMAAVFGTGKIWLRVPETVHVRVEGKLPKWSSAKDVALAVLKELSVTGALYRAIEFSGDAVSGFSISERMTLCNLAVEAGAKTGLVAPDEKTLEFLKGTPANLDNIPFACNEDLTIGSDEGAPSVLDISVSVSTLEPMVACPSSPDNVHPVSHVQDSPIHQAFLGSCTNGRIDDLRKAAAVLKGREVAEGVRFIVSPASRRIYTQALDEGLIKIFTDAGALFTPAGCSACFGGHTGVLAPGEVCVSTSNRNFVGRMGSKEAKIYLASPVVVAASAVAGRIVHPKEVL